MIYLAIFWYLLFFDYYFELYFGFAWFAVYGFAYSVDEFWLVLVGVVGFVFGFTDC